MPPTFSSVKNLSHSITESLERLRITSNIGRHDWFDILQLTWSDYQQIRLGHIVPDEKILERAANYFKLNPRDILAGNINYTSLALKNDSLMEKLPETYSKAAYGRMRTSISSVNFLEKAVGWRLRLDAIRNLKISESMLQDPFASISMKFITDLCNYLQKRSFGDNDFFAMGAYTFESNDNTIVSKLFSEFASPKEAYEFFFNDCMKLFEQNCTYTITKINDASLTMEYLTNPDVAAEVGTRHLGSPQICQLKKGVTSVIPRYLGLAAAKVNKVSCVHSGDPTCRFDVDFSAAQKMRVRLPSLDQ